MLVIISTYLVTFQELQVKFQMKLYQAL